LPKSRILTQQAIPGANQGEAFTANINTRIIAPGAGEAYWESIQVSLKSTVSVASVALETLLGTCNPFTFVANDPRITGPLRDYYALSTAFYKSRPNFFEGTLAEAVCSVHGIRIPLWLKIKPSEVYSWFATFSAGTNLSLGVIDVDIRYYNAAPNTGRIDARQIPFTTPAAAGIVQVTPKLPKLGKMRGLLTFANTVPDLNADAGTVNRLFLDTPTQRILSADWADMRTDISSYEDFIRADTSTMVSRDVLQNYAYIDLAEEGIDLVANDVALTIDAEKVSDTARFYPIIEVPQ